MLRTARFSQSGAALIAFAAHAALAANNPQLPPTGLSKLSQALIPAQQWKQNHTSPLANSLIFDQKTDVVSYRPVPAVFAEISNDVPMPVEMAAAVPAKQPAMIPVNISTNGPIHVEVPSNRIARADTDDAQQEVPTAPRSPFHPVYRNQPERAPASLNAPALPRTETPSIAPTLHGEVPTAPLQNVVARPPTQTVITSLAGGPSPFQPVNKPKPAEKPAEKPIDKPATPTQTVATKAIASTPRKKWVRPKNHADVAQIFVISERSLVDGSPEPVADATVEWVGIGSGLKNKTDANGLARVPYPMAESMRFVVRAPGYLPAVGYSVAGLSSPVVLIAEERLPSIIKSLGVVQDPDRHIVIGKVIDQKMKPLPGMTLDANVSKPFRSYYSVGSMGLFHPNATQSGTQGDFLITGLGSGVQYLMPTQNIPQSLKEVGDDENRATSEWPAALVDFSGLPEVVTLTIEQSEARKVETQIVDSFLLERPEAPIHVTVGGQRGVHVPDEDGDLKIDTLHFRSSIDIIEVKAQGYLRTWINALPTKDLFPTSTSLFTWAQLENVFKEDSFNVQFSKGFVFGHLRPEKYRKPISVAIYDARGRRNTTARIFYFDANNVARSNLGSTSPLVQSFALANMEAGEWHLVVKDAESGRGLASQVVRTDGETVTQVEF